MSSQQAREHRRFWEQMLEQLDIRIEIAIEDDSVSMKEFDTLLQSKQYCYDMISNCIKLECL